MAASRQHSQNWLSLWMVAMVIMVVLTSGAAGAKSQNNQRDQVRRRKIFLDGEVHRGRNAVPQRSHRQRSVRPNIVMILTDDQDVMLGSLKVMPKLHQHLTAQGAYFSNMFVSTPMCCPSRSTILTGLYVHNHNVYTNNDNCSSPQWIRQHEPRTFAPYLQKSGYRTGYFGKYLNKYNGTYTPVGWDKWVGLVRNSRFYNYTLSYNGKLQRYNDNYYSDYLTDRVANDSVAFFKESKQIDSSQPVMMVLSVPAPHGPEDAAPQYQHMFVNNSDHRTASWNVAPNHDKQWLLQQIQPMTPQFKIFTDLLQRRRLQTLQSVDDLVEKVTKELEMLGELHNTYIMYTSDHGYHLGQFGLIKGKSMAYDFDTRVPLIIKGPGIKAGAKIPNMAANVDLAATLLDMGEVQIPDHMDGQSLLPLLKATNNLHGVDDKSFIKTVRPWRDSILLSRGKVSKRMWKMKMKEEKTKLMQQNQKNLHLYLPPKQQKIVRQCSKPKKEYQLPCKPGQKWYCLQDIKGRTRLHKCRHADRDRHYTSNTVLLQKDQPQVCMCSDGRLGVRTFSPSSSSSSSSPSLSSSSTSSQTYRLDKQRHRRFLRQHKKKAKNRVLRHRRSVMQDAIQLGSGSGYNPSYPLGSSSGFDLFTRRCRILGNQTVTCDQDIYRDYNQWETHKERLDEMIKEYRKILDDLRNIREHLSENRPPMYVANFDGDGGEEDTLLQSNQDDGCDCDTDSQLNRGTDRRTDRELQRQYRREQKLLRRAQRRDERNQRRGQKKGRKKNSCNGHNMKCFSHDNDHWKTPPYWHYGPFCFCSNANNNTYWCMRTVNATSDFLYCEYITNFISFYNMTTDPDQLVNVAKKLNYGVLQQLHEQLAILKVCSGKDDCDLHNSKDSHILRSADHGWRDRLEYEDNSGEGDDYDDEDNYPTHYHGDTYGRVYNGNSDDSYYDEYQLDNEQDPDFF